MDDVQRYSFDILPLHPRPQKGEAFISYLARLAECNGITSLTNFAHVAFPEKVYTSKHLLTDYPRSSYRTLSFVTGLPEEAVLATTFFYLLKRFGCATHPTPMKRFLGASIASSLRYCPLCLDEQLVPFYALVWQFVSIEGCEKHSCYLLDKCGHCGAVISPFIHPLRITLCPRCSGDLRTCHTFPVQQEKLQIIRKRTFDLEFLLSNVSEQKHSSPIAVIGQQLAQKRQSTQVSLSKWARGTGLDESIILAIETGNIKMKGVTFDSYVLYTEALGITLHDLWSVELSDYLKEEDVIRRMESAIKHIKALGEPLYRKKIREMVGLPRYYLNKYPQAKALLKLVKNRYDCKTDYGVRRGRILLERVEQVIKELEAMGSLVTQECIVQMVGLSRHWLFLHPQVKTRLQQFPLRQLSSSKPCIQRQKTNRIKHVDEEHLVTQVEHAIKQLSFLGRPLTQRAVCSVVGCSLWKLRSSPRVREILAQIKTQYAQDILCFKLQREDIKVVLVKSAIEELNLCDAPLSLQNISEMTGLSLDWLRHSKRARELLTQYNERNQELRQRVLQRERELVKLVTDTIHYLVASGQSVTIESISQTVELSELYLRRYRRVKKLLDPYSEGWYERKQRDEQLLMARIQKAIRNIEAKGVLVSLRAVRRMVHFPIGELYKYPKVRATLQELKGIEVKYQAWQRLQREEGLIRQIEDAIIVLKTQNEPITPRSISNIIHLPFHSLDEYPLVKARLRQIVEQSDGGQSGQILSTEDELIQQVQIAVELLKADGKKVTPRRLSHYMQVPLPQLRLFPEVNNILILIDG